MGLRLGPIDGFGKVVLGVAQRVVGTDKRYGPIVEINFNFNKQQPARQATDNEIEQ